MRIRRVTATGPLMVTDGGDLVAYADHERIVDDLMARGAALRARVAEYETDIDTKVRLIQDLCAMQKEHEDRILAQEARIAELEADAARWRFLRLRGLTFVPGRNTFLLDYLRQKFFAEGGIDAAIDAARLSGNKTGSPL